MVYCDLKQNNGGLLTYNYGGYGDRSGIVVFDAKNGTFDIIKKPENSIVFLSHLDHLARRTRGLYEKGIVKERMAHEI